LVPSSRFNKEMSEAQLKLESFDRRLDELLDSQKSLQNWIEKYEPLKV